MPQIIRQPADVADDERLLTERQAATFCGLGWPLWTRERARIPYIQVGKFKRYTKKILRRYQQSCIVKPAQAAGDEQKAREQTVTP